MKQLLILFTFLSLGLRSQIKVDSVIPTRLCPGDSITVYYSFIGPDTTVQINMDGPAMDHIWQIYITGNGEIKLKTPSYWDSGESYISGDWTNSVNLLFCSPVGIEENKIDIKDGAYKYVYGNIYVKNGKKFIFVE